MSVVPRPPASPRCHIRCSGVSSDTLASPPAPRHRPIPQGHGRARGSAGAGRANGEGDAAEAMAGDTNKPGAGLTGLPGKPISPFIPGRPGGPWNGQKTRMRVLSVGAPPLPGGIPMPPLGHEEEEDGEGDLPMAPSGPAAPAPPANSGEGKGITTGAPRHLSRGDVPPTPARHPPFPLSPWR